MAIAWGVICTEGFCFFTSHATTCILFLLLVTTVYSDLLSSSLLLSIAYTPLSLCVSQTHRASPVTFCSVPHWSAKHDPRITMPTQSPYTWIDPVYQVAFRMNSTDNRQLNYICCTEAALGQATGTALAIIPLTGTESPTDLKTLLLRCRELLKRLDHSNVHR